MKNTIVIPVCLVLFACQAPTSSFPIQGTWRLVTGTVVTRGVPVVTDYTRGKSFIKIINGTHFAFLNHDVGVPKDSSNHFDGGGGNYTLKGDQYTEHLDYYTDKQYEGNAYTFTVSFHGDTLVQQGMEGPDRENTERYVRVK
ncbi:MAG TPA: hypothetical protein VG605_10815 [Puia sp.]|nr:hypothetical protein [Puia sp.]